MSEFPPLFFIISANICLCFSSPGFFFAHQIRRSRLPHCRAVVARGDRAAPQRQCDRQTRCETRGASLGAGAFRRRSGRRRARARARHHPGGQCRQRRRWCAQRRRQQPVRRRFEFQFQFEYSAARAAHCEHVARRTGHASQAPRRRSQCRHRSACRRRRVRRLAAARILQRRRRRDPEGIDSTTDDDAARGGQRGRHTRSIFFVFFGRRHHCNRRWAACQRDRAVQRSRTDNGDAATTADAFVAHGRLAVRQEHSRADLVKAWSSMRQCVNAV
jgi:hypothetical protein